MKKIILTTIIITLTTSVFAQYETNLKLGSSVGKENATFGGKVGFYIQGAFGYRFLADKHITLIPSVFIDKSAYTMENLTFGGLTNNQNGTFKTSTLSYQLYGVGINVSSEIKFLNLAKKTNFYIAPGLAYRRIFSILQTSSNPNLVVSKHPDINQGFIIDWSFELGVKLQRFKFGISLRNVLNQNNKKMSSFVITNAFSFSVSYLFGGKGNTKITEE